MAADWMFGLVHNWLGDITRPLIGCCVSNHEIMAMRERSKQPIAFLITSAVGKQFVSLILIHFVCFVYREIPELVSKGHAYLFMRLFTYYVRVLSVVNKQESRFA